MALFVQSTEKSCHTVVGVSHSVNSKCGEKARPSRFQWWIKRRNPTLWIRHGVFQSRMMVQDLESRHSKVRQNAQPKFKILDHPATLKDAMSNPKCRISTFAHYWKRQDLTFWPHFVSAVWHTYNRMTTFFCTLDKNGHFVNVRNVTCLHVPFAKGVERAFSYQPILQKRIRVFWNDAWKIGDLTMSLRPYLHE